jgi:ribosomal peptide maturation radical SAM protein 1
MQAKTDSVQNRVVLISAPWPLYTRPSIQLGALKAYISSQLKTAKVDAYHLYLTLAAEIGYKRYHHISERTWLAESIYAALLYPRRFNEIKALFERESKRVAQLKNLKFEKFTAQIKKSTDAFIGRIDWNNYWLAGFSVSLCQLTSSLYFLKAVKKKNPDMLTVLGGSTFSEDTALKAFTLFPEIDVIVIGEGELPFSQLIRNLKNSRGLKDLPAIKGVLTRYTTSPESNGGCFSQLNTLDNLPTPDYEDYFKVLSSFPAQKTFFPTLPVEFSRGCWWRRTDHSGKSTGCAFCNLNLQWSGYRVKKPSRIIAEIDALTSRHKTLSIAIADNVIPKATSAEIFTKLATLRKDLRVFAEIRANTPLSELRRMRKAGVQELQVGIEALSSRLLKKLKKGTTAIQNLEIMRNCEALGIANLSNLILQFPGSDAEDVNETMQNIDFALPFRPLKSVVFWLGFDSPAWQRPRDYGIISVFNHPNWRYLFPSEVHSHLPLMIQSYRGDIGYQKKIWRPVRQKVKHWFKVYNDLQNDPSSSPILSFRDGRDFLIIRQKHHNAETTTHRLVGTSREIYSYCLHHRPLKKIRDRFPKFPEDQIVSFLRMMVEKKLMFHENEKYLSLAAPISPQHAI